MINAFFNQQQMTVGKQTELKITLQETTKEALKSNISKFT